jgi:membrane associated rhomboid family serine protease
MRGLPRFKRIPFFCVNSPSRRKRRLQYPAFTYVPFDVSILELIETLMMSRLTPIVRHLVIINVVVYLGLMLLTSQAGMGIYTQFFSLHKSNALGIHNTVNVNGKEILLKPGADAAEVKAQLERDPELRKQYLMRGQTMDSFQPVQVVTYFFSHSLGNFLHIIFNMLVLASLGPITESVLGGKRFLRFYLFCGLFAGLALAFLDPSPVPVVGASTAVSGILVAFAMFFPRQKLQFFLIPIGFEARWFVLGIGVLSAVLTIVQVVSPSMGGSVSHFGHLMGMIGAIVYFYVERLIPGAD